MAGGLLGVVVYVLVRMHGSLIVARLAAAGQGRGSEQRVNVPSADVGGSKQSGIGREGRSPNVCIQL
jgi:hypothetical protein